MASEEQCSTAQFDEAHLPSVIEDENFKTTFCSQELPQGSISAQSDHLNDSSLPSSCHEFVQVDDSSASINTADDKSECVTHPQGESGVDPNKMTPVGFIPKVELFSIQEYHSTNLSVEGTKSNNIGGSRLEDNLTLLSTSANAAIQHDSEDPLEVPQHCRDSYTGENPSLRGDWCEESTVISSIPCEGEKLNAKNMDVITDVSNFFSFSPPGESPKMHHIFGDFPCFTNEIGMERVQRPTLGGKEPISLPTEPVLQDATGSLYQTSPDDHPRSISQDDEINENLTVENLTVIDIGNNENRLKNLNQCNHPLGLVIDILEKTKIDLVGYVTPKDSNVVDPQNPDGNPPKATLKEASPLKEGISSTEGLKMVCDPGAGGKKYEGGSDWLCDDPGASVSQTPLQSGRMELMGCGEVTSRTSQDIDVDSSIRGSSTSWEGLLDAPERGFDPNQPKSISSPAILKAEVDAEIEPRRSSLLTHGGHLPTISEKATVEDAPQTVGVKSGSSDDDFKMEIEFSLENSPMLRGSRRRNHDRKRKDCRHLFEDPHRAFDGDGSGTSEEDEQWPPFHSIRDSLDISKTSVGSDHDSSSKNDSAQDLLNHNDLSSEEGLPVRDKTLAPAAERAEDPSPTAPRKLTPYPGHCISSRKKTSLKGEKAGTRRVSFPEDDSRLITGYLEPFNPWPHKGEVSTDAIGDAYRKACERHKMRALPIILQQIAALPVGVGGRIECLSLRNHRLESGHYECMEELFRRVQFQTLDFEGCELDDETAIPLFEMIEFYDSAMALNISANAKIGARGWQTCSRMMKSAPSLRMLEARATNLGEHNMLIVCKALRLGTGLHTLHLENCNLTGRPLACLVGALRLNDTITDLYLADNRLGANDCIPLGNLVRANPTLRLLDLRNNNIQDSGCNHICRDIAEHQTVARKKMDSEDRDTAQPTPGLKTLVLWNNHITVHAVSYFSLMLGATLTLETLNLGRNNLTSEGVLLLKNALIRNRSLRRLGLQATRIGDEGAVALAECLADNPVLARLDLRENSIHVAGLMALCRSLKINRSVIQLDLDSNPRAEPSSEMSEQLVALLLEVKTLCQRNQTDAHLREASGANTQQHASYSPPEKRKISLTCDTVYRLPEPEIKPPGSAAQAEGGKRYWSPAPSPSVSPCPSPSPSPISSPLKTRFWVSRVAEGGFPAASVACVGAPLSTSAPSMGGSLPSLARTGGGSLRRFTVTKVAESSDLKNTSRAMSSPSLIIPVTEEGTPSAPTIVVSSPSRAVRGFSVVNVEPLCVTPERSSSLDLPSETGSSLIPQESEDVLVSPIHSTPEPSPVRQSVSLLPQRAPLASIEAGSFDSDSEESEAPTLPSAILACTAETSLSGAAWRESHKGQAPLNGTPGGEPSNSS